MSKISPPEIILASTSPRRKEILALLGLSFEVVVPDFQEEALSHATPREEALLFAEAKARSISEKYPSALIIGSDTLIEFQGEKIGKPADSNAAIAMLGRLQGETHPIWTSLFVLDTRDATSQAAIEKIGVCLKSLSEAEIKAYVATGEPLDKAGAYAVQGEGRRFIQNLKGDFFAAMGLPLRALGEILRSYGLEIPRDLDRIYQEKSRDSAS